MYRIANWFNDIASAIWTWAIKYRPRRPVVKNYHHLTVADLRHLRVANQEKFKKVNLVEHIRDDDYELSGHAGINSAGESTHFYSLVFHDINSKNPSTSIVFENDCGPLFLSEFYKKKDLHKPADLQLQERFLRKINSMIDEGILCFG